jgi:hypothetical protein
MVSEWSPVFSLQRDVIGWRLSKTRGETLREKDDVSQFPSVNNGILVGDNPKSDTTNIVNEWEIKIDTEERKLHRLANVYICLGMWQGIQNICATRKESRTQHKRMTPAGCISLRKVILNDSWSRINHDGAAAFKLSEGPHLPPAVAAKNLPGGGTEI